MKGFDSIFLRKHAARVAVSVLLATTTGAVGCLNRPIEPVEPRTTTTIVERLTQSSVDKIDIVLGIDNSRSMADKQEILAAAVPDLVLGLVNPNCIDTNGVVGATPPDPLTPCGQGLKREFDPIVDIHIGIVTSSIGGHGADSCPDSDTSTGDCGTTANYTNNDHGHLVARGDQCGGAIVPTYLDQGFLAWDPTGKLNPPGEPVVTNLNTNLVNMVKGTGQIGCGFESQLESWYRFLVDPDPFMSISVVNGYATPSPDIDLPLISQRAQFLRPDSLLAIIMLTDENDCSIKESGQNFYAGQLRNGASPFHLPRARAVCDTNPNDPCCYSCGQTNIPPSCANDPACTSNGNVVYLDDMTDAVNLRCWEQKRRFGIDFLYPIERYVQAITNTQIPNRAGQLVPNPLFSDLNAMDMLTNIRDPGLVFVAGIVGVPWQDIARDPNDLTKGFKNADELAITDPNLNNKNVWDIILGDPFAYVDALDPLMVESVVPRTGTHPFLAGASPVPPSMPLANPINGNEWTISGNNDLQYACIFPLATPRDCASGMFASCDCEAPGDNPLCQGTTQVRAKGYPGLRELSVLRGAGTQGIVASVCPAQTSNTAGLDYGYRPAIRAIIDRLKDALKGQCLPRTLHPDKDGQVPCLILEARNTQGMGCLCDPNIGRIDVSPEHAPAVTAALEDPIAKTSGWDCFCEIPQAKGGHLDGCLNDESDVPQYEPTPGMKANANGWCYIDATTSPPLGDPLIVEDCPETEKRIIRFVGTGEAQTGATLFITCSGE